ncbi:MAG: hypothetical protein IFK91_08345 [Acidobacteria bacterium]|nr:hypothetical protein [Candidatus Sulfomarinibacter sp. MAG AM1]
MTVSNCPEHGNLVQELACGRLDDRRAMEAEAVRGDCAVCAQWWSDTFGEESVAELDAAVAEVFQSYVAPKRRRFGWLAAAAAAVLAVGLGTTTLLWHDAEIAPSGPASVSTAGAALSTWDFESGGLDTVETMAADTPIPGDQAGGETAVFESGLESGDLSSWTSHS